eukprot:Skav235576  [mRNA]  locus=scaffold612:100010:102154:- [translate_table: standard]
MSDSQSMSLMKGYTNLVPRRHNCGSTGAGHLVLCNNILEFQESLVGLLSIRTVHQGLHVSWHFGVRDVFH